MRQTNLSSVWWRNLNNETDKSEQCLGGILILRQTNLSTDKSEQCLVRDS